MNDTGEYIENSSLPRVAQSSRRGSGWPVLMTGGLAMSLLMLTGCSGNNSQRADAPLPNSDLRIAESAPPQPIAPAPAVSEQLHVYGPRPQVDIDRLFDMPVTPIVSTPAPHVFAPSYVSSDEAVTADAAWDVQISREWRHIVVHHSASAVGSAAIFDRAHRERGWDGLGYHFVIGNGSASGDGQVEVGYRWSKQIQGAHAGNAEYNQHGIGICLVGDFQNGGGPSPAQMASLRRLVRFLQVKTGIPTSEVIGHGNVPGKSTQCPGRNLDVASFRSSLGGNAIPVPIHYTASAGGSDQTVSHSTRVAHHSTALTSSNAMSMP